MATNKTEHLQMNDWVGTDPIRREEINDNFRKIDEKARVIDETIEVVSSQLADIATINAKTGIATLQGINGNEADASSKLQAFIDFLNARGGGQIDIRDLTFNILSDIEVKDGVKLIGHGIAKINLKGKMTFKGNNICRGITFDGQLLTKGIKIWGNNVTFEFNTVKNFKSSVSNLQTFALHIQVGSAGVYVRHNTFDNIRPYNEVSNDANDPGVVVRAIYIEKVYKTFITNNIISNVLTLTGAGDSLHVQTTQIPITDTVFTSGYYWDYSEVYLINNLYKDVTRTAIKLQASGVFIQNEIIRGSIDTHILVRGYDVKDTVILGLDVDVKSVQNGAVFQFTGFDSLNIKNCRGLKNAGNATTFSPISFAADISTGRNVTIENCELYGYLAMTGVSNAIIQKNAMTALTSDQQIISVLAGNNIRITDNKVYGFPYSFIRVDNSTEVTNNLYVMNNTVEVDYIFISLVATQKNNIQAINNVITWRSATTPSIVTYGFVGQDKSLITIKGNTPTKGVEFGVTADRPTTKKDVGFPFFDQTISKGIVWDGTKWIEKRTSTIFMNGDGSTLTKLIPHGLGVTPSYWNVMEASLHAGDAGIKYVTADATNLTVNFKTAPVSGTGNVILKWTAEV
jgi:hypothetical protein